MDAKEKDICIRCGQPLRETEEEPVMLTSNQGELCPECYRDLTPEEYRKYFGCRE